MHGDRRRQSVDVRVCAARVISIHKVYYDQCDEDMYKSIALLVSLTGLHPELVAETHPEDDGKLEEKEHKEQTVNDNSSAPPRFRFVEQVGDLFSCGGDVSLCHCVSTDMVMGKGIATAFKAKFGGVQELKKQHKEIGQVAILRRDGRFIYYLITKGKYWNSPTYEALQKSLEEMKRHAAVHGVAHIAMPRIACGLDGLIWPKVRQLIQRVFADSNLTVTVYSRDT